MRNSYFSCTSCALRIYRPERERRKSRSLIDGRRQLYGMQLRIIRSGFDEMNEIFQAAMTVDWEQDVAREYFGTLDRMGEFAGDLGEVI